MTSRYLRQQGLVDEQRLASTPFTLIGAGAIGSFTLLSLAKMGARDLTVYDPDRVEQHNLPSQFYRVKDLGVDKVVALAWIVDEHTGVGIKPRAEKYTGQELQGIVIACPDNMETRKAVWRRVKRNVRVPLYLDARMGAEVARIWTINPITDIDLYQASLYDSTETLREPCTRRAVIYTVLGISAWICGQVKKWIENEPVQKELVLDFKLGMILP